MLLSIQKPSTDTENKISYITNLVTDTALNTQAKEIKY